MKALTAPSPSVISRRDFVRSSAVTAVGVSSGLLATGNFAYAEGSDRLRVGLVGCGGRGKGAAVDVVQAADGVEIVALADVFEDKIREAVADLTQEIGGAFKVTPARHYVGFDAYEHLIEDPVVDYVLLAAPGGFRPLHLRKAVEAGKHTFAEKPISVDPVGCRAAMQLGQRAREKGLGILAGTQRRHQRSYREAIRRVHDGQAGEILSGRIYFNSQGLRYEEPEPHWTSMEYQIRNFRLYTHLSGDCPLELLIHNIDVANWVMQSHPVRVFATGGRESFPAHYRGNIYDHFGIDFEYPNGVHIFGFTRRQEATQARTVEEFTGTEGVVTFADWGSNASIRGSNPWRYDSEDRSAFVEEHADFIASIRSGEPLNEVDQVAESNLTAIMARESAYTGNEVTWDEIVSSVQDLSLSSWELGPSPEPPVAVPGQTKLDRNWLGEEISRNPG